MKKCAEKNLEKYICIYILLWPTTESHWTVLLLTLTPPFPRCFASSPVTLANPICRLCSLMTRVPQWTKHCTALHVKAPWPDLVTLWRRLSLHDLSRFVVDGFFFPPQNNYIFIVVFVPFVRFKPSSFIQIQTFWPTWKSFKNERFLLNIFLAFVSFVFPLFCFRSFEKSRLGLGEGWRKEIKKLKLNKRTHRMVRLSVLKNHRRLCEKWDFHNFKNSFPSTLRASTWPVSFCSFRRDES